MKEKMYITLYALIIIFTCILFFIPVSLIRTLVLFISILMAIVLSVWWMGFQYISLILVMVYVSAISILFAMVIMVTEQQDSNHATSATKTGAARTTLMGITILWIIALEMMSGFDNPQIEWNVVTFDIVKSVESCITSIMVDEHVFGIILLAVILLLGVIGVLIIL